LSSDSSDGARRAGPLSLGLLASALFVSFAANRQELGGDNAKNGKLFVPPL
jgi:hypothetical protein